METEARSPVCLAPSLGTWFNLGLCCPASQPTLARLHPLPVPQGSGAEVPGTPVSLLSSSLWIILTVTDAQNT